MWLQEVSALTGQGEGNSLTHLTCCDWCCDWVSLGHHPLQGKMFNAKSLCEEVVSAHRRCLKCLLPVHILGHVKSFI